MISHGPKGARYLGSLDEALCNGSWNEVGELARKVDKHSPQRKYLTLTARTEAQVAINTRRPSTAGSTTSQIPDTADATSKLSAAISDSAYQFGDDVYCAKVCLAGIHWIQHEYDAALKALPNSGPSERGDGQHDPLGWLEVCTVKAAFIRATSLERVGRDKEANLAYLDGVRHASSSRTLELRRWTERLLATGCMFKVSRQNEEDTTSLSESLHLFRAWKDFWQRGPPPVNSASTGSRTLENPRRTVWHAFYKLLSFILRRGLSYGSRNASASELICPAGTAPVSEWLTDARSRQVVELQSVGVIYESLLLQETQFPKAGEINIEVEEWVAQAATNWDILRGEKWSEDELGADGRDGLSRKLLDILYRAASKTFHSTAVLRNLFAVHAALGEYDLALHAFRSYEAIVNKGRARAIKTGRREPGLDDDDTAVLTAAQAIRMLCRYGDREEAEQALKVSQTLRDWLLQDVSSRESANESSTELEADHGASNTARHVSPELQRSSKAAAYRAIGIAQAHWTRLSFEADARSATQAEAIANLKKAAALEPADVATSFALAKMLAETRNESSAIDVLKDCISSVSAHDEHTETAELVTEIQQRRLMPLWHLLSFCLSAKEEYEPAIKMCSAAFEQFDDASDIFRSQDDPSEVMRPTRGHVGHMDHLEKQSVMQIKITEMAYLELTDGAHAAVSRADELLTLYTQLYGRIEPTKSMPPPKTAVSAAPSKSVGTLRSIVGSIRPRTGHVVAGGRDSRVSTPTWTTPTADSNVHGHADGEPITETKTRDTVASTDRVSNKHHLSLSFRGRHHDGDGSSPSAARFEPGETVNEKANSTAVSGRDRTVDSDAPATEKAVDNTLASQGASHPQQPLRVVEHNLAPSHLPPPQAHESQPPQQDVRLPTADPTLPSRRTDSGHARAHERRHSIEVLILIWLFIAELYESANLLDDASGAIDEADHLVETVEIEQAAIFSSARAFASRGWGGSESIDTLRAHVFSAKGGLACARALPHQALAHYEQALAYDPDHAAGIVGVAGLLMDIYEEKMAPEEAISSPDGMGTWPEGELINVTPRTSAYLPRTGVDKSSFVASIAGRQLVSGIRDHPPSELNRLAARDRAYMLLSNLTRLGQGWDNAEAWYKLARSYELSKQLDKAKQALWWVVELENHRPIRPWNTVAAGGYAL